MWGRVEQDRCVRPVPGRQAAALAPVAGLSGRAACARRRDDRRQAGRLHPRARQGRSRICSASPSPPSTARSTPSATPSSPSPSNRCRSRSCTAMRSQHHGRAAVLKHVGVEPTGEAFNSIVLDEVDEPAVQPHGQCRRHRRRRADGRRRPKSERIANMLGLFSSLAGRELDIDKAVFGSELATGHRNRAIAYMMLNFGMIERDPNEVLDLYFRQCSVNVTCRDLAIMAATLANGGSQSADRRGACSSAICARHASVMNSCGMYDYAGEWAYEVGMPAKSGVSGGIIAVIPGQIGICVFSPPIDLQGNSVRGIRGVPGDLQRVRAARLQQPHQCAERDQARLPRRSGALESSAHAGRAQDPGGEGRQDRRARSARGHCSSARPSSCCAGSPARLRSELCHRRFQAGASRRHLGPQADPARRACHGGRKRPSCYSRRWPRTGRSAASPTTSARRENEHLVRTFHDTDAALEWCEDRLLDYGAGAGGTKFGLAEINLFKGLKPDECRLLESIVQPLVFEKGDVIIREGAEANLFFVLARGTVSVQIRVPGQGGRRKRVASIGPGLSFGEMARSTAANGRPTSSPTSGSSAMGSEVEQLHELTAEHPKHHDHHPQQSDARVLRAPAPRQRRDRGARIAAQADGRGRAAAWRAALSTAPAARSARHRGRPA